MADSAAVRPMYQPLDEATADFIRALPKTEHHLHIEGALPYELLQQLDAEKFAEVPPSWDPDFRFGNFQQFDDTLLGMALQYYTSPERYYEASKIVFRRLKEEQNVRFLETSFASGVMEFVGVDGPATAEAIQAAAKEVDLPVRIFMGIHHTGYNERTQGFIDESVQWEHLDGIDLHGAEDLPLEPWTPTVWTRARDHGKRVKAHAGEFLGPDFIARVLDELQVPRIEHGVRAAADPALMERLKAEGVALDLCLISNVKLRAVPSLEAHPIRTLIDAGVMVTLNTDDPLVFGNTLFDEYALLASAHQFSRDELKQLARNGFALSELSNGEKAAALQEIDGL